MLLFSIKTISNIVRKSDYNNHYNLMLKAAKGYITFNPFAAYLDLQRFNTAVRGINTLKCFKQKIQNFTFACLYLVFIPIIVCLCHITYLLLLAKLSISFSLLIKWNISN